MRPTIGGVAKFDTAPDNKKTTETGRRATNEDAAAHGGGNENA